MLCALSVSKNEDASLSMNIFSITKWKGALGREGYTTIDSSLSIPTLFSSNRIQMNVGYKNLMALLRDAVKEKIGLSAYFCNELLNQICSFLTKFEREYQEQGSKRLDQIYPFQTTEFAPTIRELDIAGLRLITLMDIYEALSSQWELIMPEIQAAIEKEQCLTGVFFIVIPEDSHLYPGPIENTLFICIVLIKFKLEATSIKKFRYLYDNYRRLCGTDQEPYESIYDHMWSTNAGVAIKLGEKMRMICQESLPLSGLPRLLNDKSNIDTINYVCKWNIHYLGLYLIQRQ
ncbi:hypothetical protein MAM1_0050c03334 [Mucor ambiguus]|uniref:Uncharacterized protein n=1 Tax=Mucor ambiguus TaxID=91626 RepID=A0A0C9MPC3_9FUNG|nr:hypothetical protein MAM1_0050c03334 [Mucor ambiguus]